MPVCVSYFTVANMEKWVGKVAVVTGASAGIGAAIFKDLAAAGVHVVGLARRKEKMEALIKEVKNAPGKMYAVQCDITSETSIREAFEWVAAQLGGCDILINNAGCEKYTGILDEGSMELMRTVVETNILGLLLCTKEAFRQMKARDNYGYIVNINSIVGHKVPFVAGVKPWLNIYSGSKHALTATTEVLRQELIFMKNEKVRVSVRQK
jgi:NADP+-dependent farnesol dehydrogenase